MILEAFARYLKAADDKLPASHVLARWLWERLTQAPSTQVDRVLHEEIALKRRGAANRDKLIYRPNAAAAHSSNAGSSGNREAESTESEPGYVFQALSGSGQKLLNSLYHYALSWDQQKWARFVHGLKPSDFQK
jgi:hypothetical protein